MTTHTTMPKRVSVDVPLDLQGRTATVSLPVPVHRGDALINPAVKRHDSGLRTQQLTGPGVELRQTHVVALPPCCPVSGNPKEGSTLELAYTPAGWVLEVYSLHRVVRCFVAGWRGTPRYPAERNMEGMVATLAQMAADALGVPVDFDAWLVLDVDPMRLTGRGEPKP